MISERTDVGTRVAVILKTNPEEVHLLGYGEVIDHEVMPPEIVPEPLVLSLFGGEREIYAAFVSEAKKREDEEVLDNLTTVKIHMDSGEELYGSEIYYGGIEEDDLENFNDWVGERTVVDADPQDLIDSRPTLS